MSKLFLFLIKIYQKTISPDHGFFPVLRILGQCRHIPTCSQYAFMAIERHGAMKGLWLSFKRILRCW